MARDIRIKLTGMPEETGVSAGTVGELRERYRAGKNIASVNGRTSDDGTLLQDGDYVSFMPGIKGN